MDNEYAAMKSIAKERREREKSHPVREQVKIANRSRKREAILEGFGNVKTKHSTSKIEVRYG
jgi:hypothetical protein